jgi:adiponectin receptor
MLTHLLGAVGAAFLTFTFYIYVRLRSNTATSEDVVMFSCFFVDAADCLNMSAAYHAISNHSAEVAIFGNQLDCTLPFAYIQTLTS